MKKKIWFYIALIVTIITVVMMLYIGFSKKNEIIEFQTQRAGRATISNTVTATGTLEASVTVKVGTQVSGKIERLYADYNSIVHKGQLLARLDTETLESALKSSKAVLDQAEAEYKYEKADYYRYLKLIEKELIAQRDFDEVEYRYQSALASLSAARAAYTKSETNLGYAFIYSPIDGIVLEKNVEEGETVAASFETPTLFTIANDLTQMEIEANVDEADIGWVRCEQRVEFTVDAFPDNVFDGRVVEIRLMPTENNNVITYVVIINAPNPEKILMPGMTANVTFFVTEKKDVLVVPNLALEFTPDPMAMETYQATHPQTKVVTNANNSVDNSRGLFKIVWVKTPDSIFPQSIQVGDTDEINYEVLSGLQEGTEVIIAMTNLTASETITMKEESKSPFMPTPPGKTNKKQ
ncbi:MAG: hypothetical protein A2W85_10850 [Bacteroidetes bacterium GWF2_41_31]|nr:MAG: hypothetical protein A2W85_10850 [Bacteroidetes bacterium GWF2_41_31]